MPAQNQGFNKTRILFLLDASGSMYAKMEESNRINIAKKLLIRLADSLTQLENVEIALRVYGHQSMKQKRNCRDTKLEVPFGELNQIQIREKIKGIRPKGTTLIAYSLQEAAYDFPQDKASRNIIILITDGIEECDGDPCAVSLALQKQGVILKPFIIGLGKNAKFRSEFDCVGQFFEAKTEKDFQNVLNIVVSQALNNTTIQVNLLDVYGRPTETDVNMTFYESH
ncbi:MAG: VWA domain-containing protein, partial [Bacteroidota bacterium]|nr:VWA domain-containing protein [Bacteroidota bacterium]